MKKNAKVDSNASVEILPVQEDAKTKLAEELSKIKVAESEEFTLPLKLEEDEQVPHSGQYGVENKTLLAQAFAKCVGLQSFQRKGHCSISIYMCWLAKHV